MNYETASDMELSEALRVLLKARHGKVFREWSKDKGIEGDVDIILNPLNTIYSHTLNYCKSWADMGPIIQELDISLIFDEEGMVGAAYGNEIEQVWLPKDQVTRAAVIVAIQVLELKQ